MKKSKEKEDELKKYYSSFIPYLINVFDEQNILNENIENKISAYISLEKFLNNSNTSLYELQKQMIDYKEYDIYNKFFMEIHSYIRKKAKNSKHYNYCIRGIIKNIGLELDKTNESKIIKAYEFTLDHYKNDWSGYWSLIEFDENAIYGVCLWDTDDCEIFWKFIDENYPEIRLIDNKNNFKERASEDLIKNINFN